MNLPTEQQLIKIAQAIKDKIDYDPAEPDEYDFATDVVWDYMGDCSTTIVEKGELIVDTYVMWCEATRLGKYAALGYLKDMIELIKENK